MASVRSDDHQVHQSQTANHVAFKSRCLIKATHGLHRFERSARRPKRSRAASWVIWPESTVTWEDLDFRSAASVYRHL